MNLLQAHSLVEAPIRKRQERAGDVDVASLPAAPSLPWALQSVWELCLSQAGRKGGRKDWG